MAKESWFDAVPKVELHLHLEGAIPLVALWELIQKYGGDNTVPTYEALVRKFEYKNFPEFLRTWVWKNGYLRQYEDFTFIAAHVARDLAAQNIRYAEAFISPPDFHRHGLSVQKITEAVRKGLSQVSDVEVALIVDLVRDYGVERATRTLHEIQEMRSFGVIGVGIGGSEHEFPPGMYAEVYEKARQFGFRTSAHAGEAAGAASIWGALRELQVDRIGHGTRATEDVALVEYLAKTRTPIEMCPISNLRTGVVARPEAHPVKEFFKKGLLVTVNTDDPKMFGNSLADELRMLEEKLGFSRDDTRQVILNGIEASWLPSDRKAELAESFRQNPSWSN